VHLRYKLNWDAPKKRSSPFYPPPSQFRSLLTWAGLLSLDQTQSPLRASPICVSDLSFLRSVLFSTMKKILMHKSLSKLGHPVLWNMSIISATQLGFILISFGDGWSGKRHAATSLRIIFHTSSVIIGGSPPSLGRQKTHLTLCLVTWICLSPIWIVISSGSNLSNNQLRNSVIQWFCCKSQNSSKSHPLYCSSDRWCQCGRHKWSDDWWRTSSNLWVCSPFWL
jgi:hypothetical protein